MQSTSTNIKNPYNTDACCIMLPNGLMSVRLLLLKVKNLSNHVSLGLCTWRGILLMFGLFTESPCFLVNGTIVWISGFLLARNNFNVNINL